MEDSHGMGGVEINGWAEVIVYRYKDLVFCLLFIWKKLLSIVLLSLNCLFT